MKTSSYVPVLMYHTVGKPVFGKADTFLNVSAQSFNRQMRALAALGYRARTLGEVIDAFRRGLSLPRRLVAVTFDDAYACVADIAAPLLARYRFPATVFAVSGWTDAPQEVGRDNGRMPLSVLEWDRLRALQIAGWEIGGHTRTHPHLDALDDSMAFHEILSDKREIEAQLSCEVQTFCYPYGHFNTRTPALVEAAGYAGACTVRSGIAAPYHSPYLLPRVKVAFRDGVTGLLYRLLVRPGMPTFRRNRRSHTVPIPMHPS